MSTELCKAAMRAKDALSRAMYFSENEPADVQSALLQMAVIAAAQFAKLADSDLTQKIMDAE